MQLGSRGFLFIYLKWSLWLQEADSSPQLNSHGILLSLQHICLTPSSRQRSAHSFASCLLLYHSPLKLLYAVTSCLWCSCNVSKSLTSTPASTRGDAESTVLLKGEWVLSPPHTPSFLGKDKVAADVKHQRCTHFLYSSINYSTWVEWLEITASRRELSENDSSELSYWNVLLGRPLVSHIYQKTARTC